MKCARLPNGLELIVVEGDITRLKVDAIVNAANSLMIMGGGVAGAIKRRGGQEIEDEARRHAPVPVGRAIVTGAGRLPAKRVIHAPTMERPAMRIPLENAVKATRAALEAAERECLESVAFPAMGAGVGGLRVDEVAEAMTRVFVEHKPKCVKKVILVAYGSNAYREMLSGVERILGARLEDCPGSVAFE